MKFYHYIMVGVVIGLLFQITKTLENIYDTLKHDFRPVSSCVHHNQFDCPVEKGATIVINEGSGNGTD